MAITFTETGKERYRTNTQDMGWSEERASSASRQNIGDTQRIVSALLGGGLLAGGLPRRSWAGAGLSLIGAALLHRGISGYCAIFDAMGLDTGGDGRPTNRLGRRKVETDRATKIRRVIEINRPPAELYRFWRRLANLPRIMSHLESVEAVNDRMSHWKVRTIPGGPAVEWDAEIINDIENERIGWRSLHGADVDHAGSVEFEPTGDGRRTKLTVTLQYAPPAGRLGAALAKLLGEDPESKIAQDLQRFKESMEAGVYQG
ncbi:SRPBCC family protein [Nitrospira moscoviensis]|uniref:Cyclase/dehydrase n=1 Tax=Nitrospira moscoviensis TaxID=42253 RepID=A0A0K2GED6_NITMO|nr:SRPBCC family protein [Nitrospira moscoviensis]ALA59224.1 Cyclase/dehydrase [Nitrospira moscoviensis]